MKTKAPTVSNRAADIEAPKATSIVQPGAVSVFTSASTSTMSATGRLASEMDHRASDMTPTLMELLNSTDHVQHWGINE